MSYRHSTLEEVFPDRKEEKERERKEKNKIKNEELSKLSKGSFPSIYLIFAIVDVLLVIFLLTRPEPLVNTTIDGIAVIVIIISAYRSVRKIYRYNLAKKGFTYKI